MMKKLLVLALVLSVVGLANAGLSIDYVDGKVVVSNDESMLGGISVGVASDSIDITGAVLTLREGIPPVAPAAVPAITVYTATELADFGIVGVNGGTVQLVWGDAETDPTKANPAGMWFSFDLAGYAKGDASNYLVKLDLTDLDVNALGGEGQSLFLTPEPMTMLLLGLGGLFLRKKK
jgi:hypothetical protein